MSAPAPPQAPAKPAPSRTSRRGRFAVAALAVVASGGAAWYAYQHRPARPASAAANAEADGGNAPEAAVTVATARLAPGGIVRTSAQTGSVHPYEGADLYAKVSGYLVTLNVNYGDRVKKGQVLAVIDAPEIKADAEKAAADVRQAEAAVAQAVAFIAASKADREAAAGAAEQSVAEVERYTSQNKYHTKKFARYQELVRSRAIPQELADEEQEGLESARANEQAARKAVLKTKADVLAAEARVKKAEADLDEARANVGVAVAKRARADALFAYTQIVAPYDAVITRRNVFPGAFIRSAAEGTSEPLLTVARTDTVYVSTEVPDRDVPFTDVGDRAEVTLDALPGKVFRGKVSRFAQAEDPTTRTMHTEIDLPNPDNTLRPGMYGIARIFLDDVTKRSTLPASCLVGEARGGKADLYIVKDGKAKKTKVEIGADDGLRVEILGGLAPGDDVILDTGSVTDGTPVRVAPGPARDRGEVDPRPEPI